MPQPAARRRSASVPCGTSSATTLPSATYCVSGMRSEARVGAVNEATTFATWSFCTSMPISGIRSGAEPPVPLVMQVSPFAPCFSSAAIRLKGTPG